MGRFTNSKCYPALTRGSLKRNFRFLNFSRKLIVHPVRIELDDVSKAYSIDETILYRLVFWFLAISIVISVFLTVFSNLVFRHDDHEKSANRNCFLFPVQIFQTKEEHGNSYPKLSQKNDAVGVLKLSCELFEI